MYWFKELTAPKQVLIRSYVFILIENSLYTTDTGPWHTHVQMDPTNGNYIFIEFSITVFKSGEARIDYKISQMFRKLYERSYAIIQHDISSDQS